MNKKLLFAVPLMLVAVAIVCHAQGDQPPDSYDPRPPGGKRSFKVEFSISNWKKMKIGNPNKKIDKVMTVHSSFFSTLKENDEFNRFFKFIKGR